MAEHEMDAVQSFSGLLINVPRKFVHDSTVGDREVPHVVGSADAEMTVVRVMAVVEAVLSGCLLAGWAGALHMANHSQRKVEGSPGDLDLPLHLM